MCQVLLYQLLTQLVPDLGCYMADLTDTDVPHFAMDAPDVTEFHVPAKGA